MSLTPVVMAAAAAAEEVTGGFTCSLLRGPGPPLDVGDLQDGQEELEGVLDVRGAVGRLKETKIYSHLSNIRITED